MSENIDLLEAEIKAKMASYEVKPPKEVWTDIAKQRSFGHVTCNRIIQSYKMWGILLILSLIGGYFFSIATELPANYNQNGIDENLVDEFIQQPNISTNEVYDYVSPISPTIENSQAIAKQDGINEVVVQHESTPPQDITAGIHMFSFGINPKLFKGLTIYNLVNKAKGHSIVEPFEVTNYDRMHKMQRRGLNTNKINNVKS